MLNRKEQKVLETVYALCGERGSCLCSAWDILRRFSPKDNMDEHRVQKILYDLQADGYVNVLDSDRKGEPMYVLSLRAGGAAYKRETQQLKRNVAFKILLTVLCAVGSFLIGWGLKILFST